MDQRTALYWTSKLFPENIKDFSRSNQIYDQSLWSNVVTVFIILNLSAFGFHGMLVRDPTFFSLSEGNVAKTISYSSKMLSVRFAQRVALKMTACQRQTYFEDMIVERLNPAIIIRENWKQTCHAPKKVLNNNVIWRNSPVFFDFCGCERPTGRSMRMLNYSEIFCSSVIPAVG